MSNQLAIEGGSRTVALDLPNFHTASGRTFGPEEEALVIEALRSGCLSRNGGTMVKGLERDFAKAIGVPYAVACSSGTSCVHLAIAALDLEPGDEVIVPPITDIGSILPIIWQNAIPVFADVDPITLVLDPVAVEKQITPRTRAVMAVHLAGMPCPMDELTAICRRHNIVLIEDCSQAYWAEYKGKLVGSMGDMACFSLQQSKHMSCGEGGLMVTSNEAYAQRASLFADKAWPRDTGSLGACRFLFLSQNYRMNELSGAVALAQLKKVQATVARRRARATELTELIGDIKAVSAPLTPPNVDPAYWLYMLRVNESAGVSTQEFGDALVAEGVPAWVRYTVDPLYLSPIFTGPHTYGQSGYPFSAYGHQSFTRGLCPQAEAALSRVIAIHWNENYTTDHVEQIGLAIRKVAHHFASVGASR
ncbi:MAG TPA: DegT/DnrJ/EryC1/StrS family aminotransferase [Edaphobacter sp.]|nr:DegT/DnrJ/EryC1/StrS family aminotransferase [Edaphobacter sp.]